MKAIRPYPLLTVTRKGEAQLKKGHPWVYSDELPSIPDGIENGSVVDVVGEKGNWLGSGLWSRSSKIRVRILSNNPNDKYDRTFFSRRLAYAISYRKICMRDDFCACRLVFGEADSLPGLTVDLYGDLVVTQVISYGMDIRKDMLYQELVTQLEAVGIKVRGIMERNDVALRTLEGLQVYKGWYEKYPHPPSTQTEICENGIYYRVDIENGQKTGFFLDQKYNRRAVMQLARNMKVLDLFTHTGSFALNAAYGGASHVTAVDVSADAVEMAHANAIRNKLDDRMDFVKADVFDLLPQLAAQRADYNFIILDPPAFTKSRKTVSSATRGYKEINYRAMKLLPRGGFLATCSCSHFMEPDAFVRMLHDASLDAGCQLKLIEARRQAPDHPMILGIPETDYLKFYLFQVI